MARKDYTSFKKKKDGNYFVRVEIVLTPKQLEYFLRVCDEKTLRKRFINSAINIAQENTTILLNSLEKCRYNNCDKVGLDLGLCWAHNPHKNTYPSNRKKPRKQDARANS